MSYHEKKVPNSNTQKKLFFAFAVVTVVFVMLFLVILPYRFYQRDVDEATQNARNITDLVRTSILSTMMSTGDFEDIRNLLTQFQTQYDFKFRLIRSEYVEKQHGIKEDHQEKDDLIRGVLRVGKGRADWIDSTNYRYVSPFLADERCQECHNGLDGKEIKIGSVLGASEIVFELVDKRSASIRQIIELTLLMIAGLVTLGLALFFIVKKGILDPLEIK